MGALNRVSVEVPSIYFFFSMIKWLNNRLSFNYYYGLVCTEKEFMKTLKKMGIQDVGVWLDGAHARTHHFVSNRGKGCSVVCFNAYDPDNIARLKDNPIGICGLMVHEATHIKQDLMRFIGESKPSLEFEAYLMQAISEELIGAVGEALQKASTTK